MSQTRQGRPRQAPPCTADMGSQGTIGAGSSSSQNGPLQYEFLLGDFFAIAREDKTKDKTGNWLVEREKLPGGKKSLKLTDMGAAILSSWLISIVEVLVAERSLGGIIRLNDFALVDGSVHALFIPKPGNSESKQSDGKALALKIKKLFALRSEKLPHLDELPPYLDHLIKLLERIPRGPLTVETQNSILTHSAQMTPKGRVSLVVTEGPP